MSINQSLENELADVCNAFNYHPAPGQQSGSPCPNRVLQLIVYGAPGTGKSHDIENVVGSDKNTVRTTFHPDSDYATFVGCYKPSMEKRVKYGLQGEPIKDKSGNEVQEDTIVYSFVPQAFTNAYVKAWEKMAKSPSEPQYLVIEEINRGNCAQIFGDLFQLLDRKDDGYSKYSIDADSDLSKYLAEKLKGVANIPEEVKSGTKLILPPNLYIWATMNTSDQSLFPMDSAFKRRWDWEYVPISDKGLNWQIEFETTDGAGGTTVVKYLWWNFLEKVNEIIYQTTKSEDKQLGYFFCKANGGKISEDKFVNKVLFYLYNDVFKDWALRDAFKNFAFKDFFLARGKTNKENVKKLLDELLKEEPSGSADNK